MELRLANLSNLFHELPILLLNKMDFDSLIFFFGYMIGAWSFCDVVGAWRSWMFFSPCVETVVGLFANFNVSSIYNFL